MESPKLTVLLNGISEIVRCAECETRLRFGDLECPHCGKDVEDELHVWAVKVLERMG